MKALLPVNEKSMAAFENLTASGVDAGVYEANPFIAAYSDIRNTKAILEEFQHIEAAGGYVEHELVSGDEARRREPAISELVEAAVLIRGQRYIRPVTFVNSLAAAVRHRGGHIFTASAVRSLDDQGSEVAVDATGSGEGRYDAVVIATGAWLGELARPFGVRHVVQAGRGYSFSVTTDRMPAGPLYFPEVRVALTPLGERLRVAGMMEFRPPDAPLDPRRIQAIVKSTRPLLRGADLDHRQDEWVGSRPVTADGLPLIGRTTSKRVFVAGGHGMWGITLGPITGELLADQIVTGRVPEVLAPFDPLRALEWAPQRVRRRSARHA